MNNEEHPSTIRAKVLDAIERGRVTMRPRWHFVLKTILAVSGTVIVLLVLLYLSSFILFALRQNGAWFAPLFGFRGVFVFLRSLPWILIVASLVFVVILEILVKRYAFAFKRPIAYSVLGILLIVVLGSLAIVRTQLHRGIFVRVQEGRFKAARPFYREFGMHRFSDIHPGTIASTTDNGFLLTTPRDETFRVFVTSDTRLPFGFDFGEGDEVVVFGKQDDDVIQAFGIRRIDEGFMMGPGMRVPSPGFRREFRPDFRMMK